MIDSYPDSSKAETSGAKPRWMKRWSLGAACLLVIWVYAYTVHSGPFELLITNAADTYYNLLVQGFRSGQLNLKKEAPAGLSQLADPYDPTANALYRSAFFQLHDMSYYKGKLYLCFGVTPAVILLWPFVAVTGDYLFNREAVLIFCVVGFLAGVALLRALWQRYFADVSALVVAACAIALGLATAVPVLLSRCEGYEVAISCGYMLSMLALGAIWCAMHQPDWRWRWLAAASLAYGLAVGARPSLLFGAVILLVPVVQAWRAATEPGQRRRALALLMAATGPIALIGLGLMLYNMRRFGSPLDFGYHYQLAPERPQAGNFFSLDNLWYNLRLYFLQPTFWSDHFHFARRLAAPPAPTGHGLVETPFGILADLPFVWLALAVPLACRNQATGTMVRWFVMTLVVLFGTCALTIGLYSGASIRYEVEFLSPLLLLAAVGVLGSERALAGRPVWRYAVRLGWVLLMSISIAFNLLAGVERNAQSHNSAGIALAQAGKTQEAAAHFEQALRLKPNFAEAQFNEGVALAQLGNLQEAIGHYQLALRIKPDDAETNFRLGIALEQAGRVQEAINYLEQAVQSKPDHAEAHYNLGIALVRLGRVQEATAHWEQALRIKPDYAEAHYNLGVALAQAGKVQEAVEHYEQALRINPDYAKARTALSRLQTVK